MGLPLDHRARWVILGAWMSQHGDSGTLTTPESSLRKILEIPEKMITEDVIKLLPNVSMRRGVNDNDEITVIIKKWAEYQKDSTSYDRVKKWRKKQNDNGVRGEERRREKKRREKKDKNPPLTPPMGGIPDWVPAGCWESFVEMRKAKKKPLTRQAEKLAIRKLERLKTEGEDIEAILNQSILNSWSDLYPVKKSADNGRGRKKSTGLDAISELRIEEGRATPEEMKRWGIDHDG